MRSVIFSSLTETNYYSFNLFRFPFFSLKKKISCVYLFLFIQINSFFFVKMSKSSYHLSIHINKFYLTIYYFDDMLTNGQLTTTLKDEVFFCITPKFEASFLPSLKVEEGKVYWLLNSGDFVQFSIYLLYLWSVMQQNIILLVWKKKPYY